MSNDLTVASSRTLNTINLLLFLNDSGNITMFPQWLARLFRSPERPSTLTTIEMKLVIVAFHPNPIFHATTTIDWAPLAEVLSPAQFPALRRLALNFDSPFQMNDVVESFADSAKRGLHHLDRTGVLQCAYKRRGGAAE
jgi:hypothetical protein